MSLALVTKPFEAVIGRPVRFIDDQQAAGKGGVAQMGMSNLQSP